MKFGGIFGRKKNDDFFLRLIKAETYDGSVAVEAVDSKGERLSLICRISKEKGIEMYTNVDASLGFPMRLEDDTVVVQDEGTS
jgi:hypothetical protein